MSMRARLALIVAGVVVLVILWSVFVFKKGQDEISAVQRRQEQARLERTQLETTLAHLRQLQRDEPRLRAEVARLQDAVPNDPRLPDVILQLQEAAALAGIDFLSITPSVPSPFAPPGATQTAPAPASGAGGGQLQAIGLNVQTLGKYFEIEDFVVRLERLRRATRVNSFALAPSGTGQTTAGSAELAVTFQIQMFVLSPSAAPSPSQRIGATPAPGVTPPPAGAGTPSPSSSPADAGTPSPFSSRAGG